jgi:hypothetical protein
MQSNYAFTLLVWLRITLQRKELEVMNGHHKVNLLNPIENVWAIETKLYARNAYAGFESWIDCHGQDIWNL